MSRVRISSSAPWQRIDQVRFPDAALDFYDDLELDNTKSFWQAHKHVYDAAVRAADARAHRRAGRGVRPGEGVPALPRRALRARTRRRTRPPRAPSSPSGPATGWYVEIGSPGVRVGGGYYHAGGPDLARIRTAIDTEHSGKELARIVAGLEKSGFEIRGEQLKTTPRGYSADHPRIDLLRYKSMALGQVLRLREPDTPRTCSTGSATTGAPCAPWSTGSRARVDILG